MIDKEAENLDKCTGKRRREGERVRCRIEIMGDSDGDGDEWQGGERDDAHRDKQIERHARVVEKQNQEPPKRERCKCVPDAEE